jgi:hypothetical protein
MGPTDCPETSVQNYHSALRNISEERRSQLHRGANNNSGTDLANAVTLQARVPEVSVLNVRRDRLSVLSFMGFFSSSK